MKLVMMTPGVIPSAIGRMARMVTQALLDHGHEVLVVRAESADLKGADGHDFGTHTVHWSDTVTVAREMASAEMVVYHIGNYFDYHEGCIYWLEHQRGVICLHDFFLGHLFTRWAQRNRKRADAILQYWYGSQVATTYFEYSSSEEFIERTRQHAPMVEWLACQASAAICHSSFGADRVLSSCPGPVRVVPLAYEAPASVDIATFQAASVNGRLQVLTVGHVNPNKRADCVIRAIGASQQLRANTTYKLVGAVQPEMRHGLEGLAAALGVDLQIHGEVSVADLAQALRQADLICCLRKPTLEAASASTIEAMLCGRAVIVEDAGFYSELPDDCVRKIRPEHEETDLRHALEDLGADREGRHAMGERAERWAQATFTAENYASQLVEMLNGNSRSMLVSEMMQVFAGQLAQWNNSEGLIALPEIIEPLRIFEKC